MDPSTRLDHAVFQLTPTRTRCDLLVCSSGKEVYEKIASGLLEPFLSHLRCAREHIPKGGYSFTLRPPQYAAAGRSSASPPPSSATGDAATSSSTPNWFTKGTLERFVRFVSSPEILERVATIEKEIVHIESCIHQPEDDPATATTTTTTTVTAGGTAKAENLGSASSHGTGDDNIRKWSPPSKLKTDGNGHDATHVHGENSKLCLQQTLETRKAVLLKEQGMAYARATVAGYDMPHVDDLVSFADAFGASRLREACMNFKDVCERKEKDKIWMDELAAIGAHSHPELSCTAPSAIMLEAVNGYHPELNSTFSDTVADPTIATAGSDAGQDNNRNTPNRESWASANNGIFHEKFQIPIGWPSHPPYMYNFQNPAQQMPPYKGYAFPGTFPAYPPGQFDSAQNHSKPVKKKAGRSTTSGSRNGERSHDSSESGNESDGQVCSNASEEEILGKGWGHKRSNKKSSRTVVIRNINYISSERRDGEDGFTSGSSVEDDINEDFLKQKVENIVDSLKKHHKASHHQRKRKGKNKNHRNIEDDDNSSDQSADIDANAKVSSTKRDESWNAFQSILMRDEPSSTELHEKNNIRPSDSNEQEQYLGYSRDGGGEIKNVNFTTSSVFPLETESLKGTRQRFDPTNPVAANGKDDNYDHKSCSQFFDCDENYSTRMKRSHNVDEELLFSDRTKSDHAISDDIGVCENETLTPNLQREADNFIASKSSSLQDREQTAEYSMFEGDQNVKSLDGVIDQKIRNELPVDDSFIVATRLTEDEHPISHWETDMSIISGLAFSTVVEGAGGASHSKGNSRMPENYEPDDLQMVLERNMGSEPVGASWTPEIDYTTDVTYHVARESDSTHEANGSKEPPNLKVASGNGTPRNKLPAKDAKSKPTYGYLTKAKPEVTSRNRKPSTMSGVEIQRNKMLKEEENRRQIEASLAQRQKRIAERSSSSSASPSMTRVSATESKLGTGSSKQEKKTPRPVPGNSRPNILHRTEATSSAKNSHASDQFKKNAKVTAVAI